MPKEHTCPCGQALPQAPQLPGSLASVTQRPAHAVWPSGQMSWQLPAMQNWPIGQRVPQAPQFSGSVMGSTQKSPQKSGRVAPQATSNEANPSSPPPPPSSPPPALASSGSSQLSLQPGTAPSESSSITQRNEAEPAREARRLTRG